ncbi:MAG: tRNA pseudouridine(13) synthase TruD [Myxococcales bacterium]|nr:tRNA pseudouridine(13) synthase TruD [Myxococcales bacterium]MCB9546295.1 tRNA pseudouridine(13) synthase TruD [Myxococcales bacterium]
MIEPPLPAGPHCPLSTAPLAGVGGEIHNDPEHFEVDELAAYAPSGEGTHWFVQIRKVGLNSVEVRELLAAAAGVDPRDVGMAGRKDRHAITTQWFSLPAPPVDPGEERLTLLQVAQHGQKLRMGHLAGNRFRVRITGVRHPEHLPALVDGLRAGLPNYFGAQRFGRFGLADGLRLLNHPRRRVKDPKFLASVVQSAVFNHWLGARVAAGALHTAIAGDILRKRETGGLFVCAEPDVDGPRVAAGEVDPTGPLPGPKTWAAEADAAVAEAAALDALGLTPDQRHVLGRFADGTRRVARIVPADFTAEPEGDDLVVGFTLPKGAFATVVLGYLIDPTTPFGRTVVGEGD